MILTAHPSAGRSPWVLTATGDSAAMVADPAEVRRGLAILADPDGGCELMGLTSGTFATRPGSDVDGLCRAAEGMPGGIGVYLRINPVPATAARPARNEDVTRRRWLYTDVDPVKPDDQKDNPATAAEKAAALATAEAVRNHLAGEGWPAPIVLDSGNGYGLLHRCDLPNDKHVAALYRRLLAKLADVFAGSGGRIDKSVHNANRLVKLPGTWARKGVSSADRPHRVCKLVDVPGVLGLVTADMLAAAAGVEATEPPRQEYKPPPDRDLNGPGDAYARKALESEVADVATAPAGERNITLNRAAFSLGQLVGGGLLDRDEVESRLYAAASGAGLDDREIWRTIASGIEAGRKEPRGKPDRPADPKPVFGRGTGPGADKPPPDAGGKPAAVILWASSVKPRKVEWLWPGRIPLGKLTTFAGNGGLGKTFVICDIIARITRGLEWPHSGGECATPGRCLLISGEDDPDDTLVPRLIEAGADLSRVAFLGPDTLADFTLGKLTTLDAAVGQMGGDVRLVAVDPPTSYLGKVDDHKNSELRSVLSPLSVWSSQNRISTLFNTHVNKASGPNVEASMRVMGSVAWVNATRAAHMFFRDPDDPLRRFFIPIKSNLGRERKGLAYRLADSGDGWAKVDWLEEVDVTADEAANRRAGRKRSVTAADWLTEMFDKAERWPSNELYALAKSEAGISRSALYEVKEKIGIRGDKVTNPEGDTQWYWYWPPDRRRAWTERARNPGCVPPNP